MEQPQSSEHRVREAYGSVTERAAFLASHLARLLRNYLPGSRLPSERDLAEQFHVSVRVAREALAILARHEVIDSRSHKRSLVVGPSSKEWVLRRLIVVLSGQPALQIQEEAIASAAYLESKTRGLEIELITRGAGELDVIDSRDRFLPQRRSESGWMFLHFCPPLESVEKWRPWNIPMVVVCEHAPPGMPALNSDRRNAIYMATERLCLLGHRRIAYIAEAIPAVSGSAADRLEGYTLALQRFSVPPDQSLIWMDPGATIGTRQMVADRLNLTDRPTAIVTANQRIGLDVLATLDAMGIAAGKGVSVISGGLEFRATGSVPLSRLSRFSEGSPEQIAKLAIELLLSYQSFDDAHPNNVSRCEWIEGGSAGAAEMNAPGSVFPAPADSPPIAPGAAPRKQAQGQ